MNNNHSVILLNALPDKKIKSLGNKCLIKISKNYNILDYQIKIINKIFNNPEIIIVGGFDTKKLKKYIDNNYISKNIKYIDHNIDNLTNIGTSVKNAISHVSNNNYFIINSSILFHKDIISTIKKNKSKSFIMVSKNKNSIGCTIDLNNKLINCYYDLPNYLIDVLHVSHSDRDSFLTLCQKNIDKLYFFEIINLCIDNNIQIDVLNIPQKNILTIDSVQSIEKIKNKLCI